MKLYFLRHAQAGAGYPDAVRELTESGRSDVQRLGVFLRNQGDFAPMCLWCSPYVRAQQTASLLMDAWGGELTMREEQPLLVPEADPLPLSVKLGSVQQDLLLVGHNPNLSILASLLLSGGHEHTRVSLSTCDMLCLEQSPVTKVDQRALYTRRWTLDPRSLPTSPKML